MSTISKDLIRKKTDFLIAIASVVFLYAFFAAVGIGCPIKYLTGISCPGCGMTRACFAAARFHFADAFYYHPLWILPIVWFPLYISRKCGYPKINKLYKGFCYCAIAAFMIAYLVRMIFLHGSIVVFQPEQGLIGRGVKSIIDLL